MLELAKTVCGLSGDSVTGSAFGQHRIIAQQKVNGLDGALGRANADIRASNDKRVRRSVFRPTVTHGALQKFKIGEHVSEALVIVSVPR